MISVLSRSAFAQEMSGLGRDDMPERLWVAWAYGEIDVTALREWILPTWELAEWPVATLGHRRWLELFAATGFVTDGRDDPPTPLTVYRGAVRRYARERYAALWGIPADEAA